MIENKTSIYDQPLENNRHELLDHVFINGNLSRNEKLILANFIRLIETYKENDYWINMQIFNIMECCDLSRNEVTSALFNLVQNKYLDYKNENKDVYMYSCYKLTDKLIYFPMNNVQFEISYRDMIIRKSSTKIDLDLFDEEEQIIK